MCEARGTERYARTADPNQAEAPMTRQPRDSIRVLRAQRPELAHRASAAYVLAMAESLTRADRARLEEIRAEIHGRLAAGYTHMSPKAFEEMVAKMSHARLLFEKRTSGEHRRPFENSDRF